MNKQDRVKQEVEKRLRESQKSKSFKDVGRVANTRKEIRAYNLINSSMLSELEEDSVMAYKMVKKDNVWEKIDIDSLRAKEMTSGAVFYITKLRESVKSKPSDSKKNRAVYVNFLGYLQTQLYSCKDLNDVKKVMDSFRSIKLDKAIEVLIEPKFNELSESEKDLLRLPFGGTRYTPNDNATYKFMSTIKDVFGVRFLNTLYLRSDSAMSNFIQAEKYDPLSEEDSSERIEKITESYESYAKRNIYPRIEELKDADDTKLRELLRNWRNNYIQKLYTTNLEGFREMAINWLEKTLESRKENLEAKIKENQPRGNNWSWHDGKSEKSEEKKKTKRKATPINTKKRLEYIKRTGGYKADAVTPKEIVDKFGFQSVNYGTYVDDEWSKQHTNHFLGAMTDMAEMLNIDIKQVNNIGKLDIAFGAKGVKGHLATYFPQTKDINLTKGNGDGSLAHEWGHYFDNIVMDESANKPIPSFGSETFSNKTVSARKSREEIEKVHLYNAYAELMDFMINGGKETPELPCTFYAVKKGYEPKINTRKGWEDVNKRGTLEETLSYFKENAPALFKIQTNTNSYNSQVNIIGHILSLYDVDSYEIPLKLKMSYFKHKSLYHEFVYCSKGKDKRGKEVISPSVWNRTKYWYSDVELFARAWETMILRRLNEKGRVSNYLVSDVKYQENATPHEGFYEPYPDGKELEKLDELFERVINAFKSLYSINDFKPFTNVREDEYFEFESKNKKRKGEVDEGMIVEKKESRKEIEFVDPDKDTEIVRNLKVLKTYID